MFQQPSEGDDRSKRLKSEDNRQISHPTTRASSKKNHERLAGEKSQKTEVTTRNHDMDVEEVGGPPAGGVINLVDQFDVAILQNPQPSVPMGTSEGAVSGFF